jgi:hypothetical protein
MIQVSIKIAAKNKRLKIHIEPSQQQPLLPKPVFFFLLNGLPR